MQFQIMFALLLSTLVAADSASDFAANTRCRLLRSLMVLSHSIRTGPWYARLVPFWPSTTVLLSTATIVVATTTTCSAEMHGKWRQCKVANSGRRCASVRQRHYWEDGYCEYKTACCEWAKKTNNPPPFVGDGWYWSDPLDTRSYSLAAHVSTILAYRAARLYLLSLPIPEIRVAGISLVKLPRFGRPVFAYVPLGPAVPFTFESRSPKPLCLRHFLSSWRLHLLIAPGSIRAPVYLSNRAAGTPRPTLRPIAHLV
jgi:hypothetical protein